MKINLVVALYRDSYFYDVYGAAVRDLQFLFELSKIKDVEITILNKPVSIYERLIFKKFPKKKVNYGDIETVDYTSYDLVGPLKKRGWFHKVYPGFLDLQLKILHKDDRCNVFLDFLPIGSPDERSLDGWIYWYDFIDNFMKHNRFTAEQKLLVNMKYQFVFNNADFVTAVSNDCLANLYSNVDLPFSYKVVSNKLFDFDGSYRCRIDSAMSDGNRLVNNCVQKYDFGFIGFVTDKFDISFIERLPKEYSVVLYGAVLDTAISKQLSSFDNVTLMGEFSFSEIPFLINTFKVGLLPYIVSKSHDGSPLKLYEYIRYLKPVITSQDFEIKSEKYIFNYNSCSFVNANFFLDDIISKEGDSEILSLLSDDDLLITSICDCISSITKLNLK
ncbi:hypothetical protein [Shewanella fodinae]|uniref:hypothetical protein n=1 Tax=Shewanella fodinae TaxID=552357 RepID=UPI0016733294|nr:hypothetical protein [Shewanella fodinae]MCL2906284.1 hypothetical protein [Shewanella fodinae]GGZ00457.1 hypothetical protein GCM10007169_16710 [Shewanella fodinae]